MTITSAGSATLTIALPDLTTLRAQLEETRAAYHRLMESLTDADWQRTAFPTAWTVGEVMNHLADTLADKPAAIAAVRSGKQNYMNLPSFLSWLAPRINYLLVKKSARGKSRQAVLAHYNQAHAALLATIDGIQDSEWQLGAFCYGEGYKTVLDLCYMPVSHLHEHAAQIVTSA